MKIVKRLLFAALALITLAGCATEGRRSEDNINLPAGAATGGSPTDPMIPSTEPGLKY